MRRCSCGFLAVLFAFGVSLSAQTTRPRVSMPSPTGSSSQPISNTALLTWVVRYDTAETGRVELLVVWRGAAGWYRRGPRSMSGGGSGSAFHSTNRFGDLELELDFDSARRTARVQGRQIELHDDNVILVDRVDGGSSVTVTGTLHIADATFSRRESEYPRLDVLLSRSPEILAFAGCETSQSSGKPQTDSWCEQLRAR